jgi:ring-1,2-phenylacetyl-CoA epoxidase subunit PaaE
LSSGHSVFHPLTVESIEPVTDDSVAITFAVPPELRDDYAFTQGQHLNIRTSLAGDDVRRSYSICTPASSGVLRVAVKRLPGGAFSEHALESLRPGDVLDVMTPSGRFFTDLDPANAKHYVCIAAGSGITPILSIVATTLETEPRSSVTLVYANRDHRSVMFLEEVEDLKDRYHDRMQLVHVLSREPQEADIVTGRLDADRIRTLLGALVDVGSVDHWWLCGPLGMTEDAVSVLTELGVDRKRVHRELFYVDEPPPELVREDDTAVDGEGSEVTIVLNGRSTQLTLPRNVSVLDAAQKVRGDLPFACKGGVCGTCRARVTDGEVTMRRNFALEDDEVDAGFVLTCQTIPVSDRIVVDFDV